MIDLPITLYRWSWRIWAAWFVILEAAGWMTPMIVWVWLAAFGLLEALALLDPKTGDTLTENVRPLMHFHPLAWFMSAAGMTWLAAHALVVGVQPLFGHGDTLIETVRPVMHLHPVTWFLSAGFLGWLWVHFLTPDVERWIEARSRRWAESSSRD